MDEDIVISGIAGRYPESNNVQEFWNNLMSGVEISSEDDRRWPVGFLGLPHRDAKIKDVGKFDAKYFQLSREDADSMDSQIRILHETAYEAICDAGINPESLRGSNTAMTLGICSLDDESAMREKEFMAQPCNTFAAGRLSFAFDLKGPSIVTDTACASSFSALNEAVMMMRTGVTERAICSGASLNIRPAVAGLFKTLKMIAQDGRSKCMDGSADGYCRSEAVVSLFLQKRKDAKRVYATIVNCRTNSDGFTPEGITFPRMMAQMDLMRETYDEVGINPIDVKYMEAHMTGTAAGDPIESEAIVGALRPNGSMEPLLMGCLKSNMGHSEGASGVCAITKACLVFQQLEIPPNLHLKNWNPKIPALFDGRLVPVNERMPFQDNLIGVNSFGFGGVNVHCILKANEKRETRESHVVASNVLPRLVTLCGRNSNSIQAAVDWIRSNPGQVTREFLKILGDVMKVDPGRGMNARSHVILDEMKAIIRTSPIKIVEEKQQLWFFFADSQDSWAESIEILKVLQPFARSIESSVDILKRHGSMTSILLSSVIGQMALVDLMTDLEIKADGFIGNASGEIVAAYASGALSREEALRVALILSKTNQIEALQDIEAIIGQKRHRPDNWHTATTSGKFVDAKCFMAISAESRIPTNCLTVEFSVHASMNESIKLIEHGKNVAFTLEAIGELHAKGHNPEIANLYPKVEYPVARETASLSNLMRWDHGFDYMTAKYPEYFNPVDQIKRRDIDLMGSDTFICGHCIDGRILYPATGYLSLVWELLNHLNECESIEQNGIEFFDVQFLRPTLLSKSSPSMITMEYNETSGSFILSESGQVCCTGMAKLNLNDPKASSTIELEGLVKPNYKDNAVLLDKKEIYKELRTRGYDYGPSFQGLSEARSDGSEGKIRWDGEWAAFADSMLHLIILSRKGRDLYLPIGIEYLKVDKKRLLDSLDGNGQVTVFGDNICNMACTSGMFMRGLSGAAIARRQNSQVATLESMEFMAYNEENIEVNEDKQVVAYSNTCKCLVERIGKWSSLNCSNDDVKRYLECDPKSHSLLQMIDEAIEAKEPVDELRRLVANVVLDHDQTIISCLANERMIQTQVDMVLENLVTKKLEISEYNQTGHFVRQLLTKHIRNCNTTFEYTGVHSNPSVVSGGLDFPVLQLRDKLKKEAHLVVIKDQSLAFAGRGEDEESMSLSMLIDLAHKNVRKNGFLLLISRDQLTDIEEAICRKISADRAKLPSATALVSAVESAGFVPVSIKSDTNGFMSMLFKKLQPPEETANHQVFKLPFGADYSWVEGMKELLLSKNQEATKRIWLVAQNEARSGIIGLVNCLQKELGADRVRCYFDQSSKSIDIIPEEILKQDLVMNVFQDGKHGSYRFQPLIASQERMELAYLDVQTKGDMSSLKFFESPNKFKASNTIDIAVAYSALNFKDVMVASGRIPLSAYPEGLIDNGCVGIEYSGTRIDNGQRVMGIGWSMGIATTIRVKKQLALLWQVPDCWSFEQAATVPVAYATVIYAFYERGKIQRGETVLIHSGCGAVGQAALHIAQSLDCKILVTVGTSEKRQFLKETFGLKDDQIFNSRDHTFEENVLKATNGRGVDIVLNSLSEEKLKAGFRCLAEFGRFLEIGKYDLVKNSNLPRSTNRSFHVICVATLSQAATVLDCRVSKRIMNYILEMFQELLKSGVVKPLNRIIFQKDECEKAFRFMSTGKHIGKVLIEMQKEGPSVHQKATVIAIKQTYFDPSKAIIIIGGLGGIGLELSRWAVTRGAKKVVLSSRSGIKTAFQTMTVNYLRETGVQVLVLTNDVTTVDGANRFIADCLQLGPIGSIFNSALVLKDVELKDQTPETFALVCASKVETTVNLDIVSRQLCPALDNFVCFSSVTSGRGNRGQTNYGYANSVMERICEQRRRDGLPGISVQWGAVGDVGVVAEMMGGNDIVIEGTKAQRLPSLMQALDTIMQSKHSVVSSVVHAESKSSSAKFDVFGTIMNILGVKDAHNADESLTLNELGMDSLIAVEIRQVLERDYDRILTNDEIRRTTMKELKVLSDEIADLKDLKGNDFGMDDLMKEVKLFLYPADAVFDQLNAGLTGKPVFFLPCVAGSYVQFKKLVQQVSRPVIRCNWTVECDQCKTIEELAQFYIDKIDDSYPNVMYDIVAYSFGCLIALSMAAQLERRNEKNPLSRVLFFDGSPKSVRAIAQEHESKFDKAAGHIDKIVRYAHPFFKYLDMDDYLAQKGVTTEEIVAQLVSRIDDKFHLKVDPSDVHNSFARFFKKQQMSLFYDPKDIVITRYCKLFRAKASQSYMTDVAGHLDETYGLEKYCKGQLEQMALTGDHGTFMFMNPDVVQVAIEGFRIYV